MNISEVRIDLVKPNNGLIGFASFVIDGDMFISSVAIHTKLNEDGFRLTYPCKGQFTVCHPIHKRASKEIEDAIFGRLKDVMKKVNRYDEKTF